MYRESMKQILITATIALFLSACGAQNSEHLLEGRVNDKVGLLSAEVVEDLDDTLESYERQTCHQIAVLVVASTGNESINAYSLKIANQWGIGHKNLDNGVLVTVAVNDKRLRIEVGNGLTQYLTDEEAAQIIKSDMVPAIKSGDVAKGIKQGIFSIMKRSARFSIPKDLRPNVCAGT
jgi:uncharacterized protein